MISGILLDSGSLASVADSLTNSMGFEMFEEEIDEVIFQTNDFLTNPTFTGESGPFWYILQMSVALGALFSVIMAGSMTFKMLVKGDSFDVFKILKILAIAVVFSYWYPSGNGVSVTGVLSYIPNCIGSYTKVLYDIEQQQVQGRFEELLPLIEQREDSTQRRMETYMTAKEGINSTSKDMTEASDVDAVASTQKKATEAWLSSSYAGLVVMIDKLLMFMALITFRVGWWATIYVQQILLGMLTIFGPILWAFSILSKWEGAWAKWITRYLTVHFYGAMLYFVGFYVLLLFDIVLSLQIENLRAILQSPETFENYLSNTFFTAGYLVVASIVSLKCLNLVPDLASWMIPEGDTAFSTRNFGEGVAGDAKRSATSMMRL